MVAENQISEGGVTDVLNTPTTIQIDFSEYIKQDDSYKILFLAPTAFLKGEFKGLSLRESLRESLQV